MKMINTLQELLEDYARFSCMEDRIDPETSEELQKGAKDYLKQLNELNLLTLTDVVSTSCDKCDNTGVLWSKDRLSAKTCSCK